MIVKRSDEYFEYALRFTEREIALREFFGSWLPVEIIDCHVHTGLSENKEELEEAIYARPFSSFSNFDLLKSQKAQDFFYPGKKVRRLRFAQPYRGIDHRQANNYLFQNCPPDDKIALYGIPDDIDYTVGQLKTSGAAALKMYYFFFCPPAEEIYQFFPKPILEEAQARGVPIILHLPQNLSQSVGQVVRLVRDFSKLIVVLAHLGIYSEPLDRLREAYQLVVKYEKIYLDTAMVFSSEAIGVALRAFGSDRILYGSDEPLSYLRVKMYEHPVFGFRLVSEYPYHWLSVADLAEFGNLAHGALHAHWQTLLAIRTAVEGGGDEVSTKEKIFYANSKKIFSFD